MASTFWSITLQEILDSDPYLQVTASTQFTIAAAEREIQLAEDIVVGRMTGRLRYDSATLLDTANLVGRLARSSAVQMALATCRYRSGLVDARTHESEMRIARHTIDGLAEAPHDAGAQQPTGDDAPGLFTSNAGRYGATEPCPSFLNSLISNRRR